MPFSWPWNSLLFHVYLYFWLTGSSQLNSKSTYSMRPSMVLPPPAGNHPFLWTASIGLVPASTQAFWLALLFLFVWLTIFGRLGATWEQDPHLNHHCVPCNVEHWAWHLQDVLDYLESIWNRSHPISPRVFIAGEAENYISQNPVAVRGITSFRIEGNHYFLEAVAGRWGSSCGVPSSFQASSLKIIGSSSAAWGVTGNLSEVLDTKESLAQALENLLVLQADCCGQPPWPCIGKLAAFPILPTILQASNSWH